MSRFFDESSGATLYLDRYYGFSDAGGLAGSFDGYGNVVDAMTAIKAQHGDDVNTSSNPEDLGGVAICVLTGQQYVDRLRQIDDLATYGCFVE